MRLVIFIFKILTSIILWIGIILRLTILAEWAPIGIVLIRLSVLLYSVITLKMLAIFALCTISDFYCCHN